MSVSHEEAVIVRSVLPEIDDDALESLRALEDDLASAIEMAGVGELDGNEVGQRELVLYMYGPNAEYLFETVAPALRRSQLMKSASVVIRYGPPGATCRFINL